MKPIRIRIDEVIRIRKDLLDAKTSDSLKSAFIHSNPEFQLKRHLNLPGWWNIPKDVGTFGEDEQDLILPRGGMSKVREALQASNKEFQVFDHRCSGGIVEDFPEYKGLPLRYYQEDAIQAAIKKENCIIRLPTGSGKSYTAIALATRIKLNTLIVLPTVGLFNQWVDDACEVLQCQPDDLGIIHQKKFRLRPITASVQGTLAARGTEQINDYFGAIIVDEVQRAPARTYMKVIGSFRARYRVGFSADERRKDKMEFLGHGLFGDVAYEKKRKELEEEGFIVDVEIRVIPTDFRSDWYGMSTIKGKRENADFKNVDFDRLLRELTADENRTNLALDIAYEEAREGRQILILSHRREHCIQIDRKFVQRSIPSGFFIGGQDNRIEFEKTRAGIKDGSVQVGIGTYSALGVGVNLPAVEVGFALTPISGNRFFLNQVRGRFNRSAKNKQRARLYVLWDRFVYPTHLNNLIAWNPTVKVLDKGVWSDGKIYEKKWKAYVRDQKKVLFDEEEE